MAAEAAAFASDGHDGIHEPLLHPEDNLPTSPLAIGRSSSLTSAIGPHSTSLQRNESGCGAVPSVLRVPVRRHDSVCPLRVDMTSACVRAGPG